MNEASPAVLYVAIERDAVRRIRVKAECTVDDIRDSLKAFNPAFISCDRDKIALYLEWFTGMMSM